MRRESRKGSKALFVSIVLVAGALFGVVFVDKVLSSTPKFALNLPSASNNYIFGSSGNSFTGWLIPAHTVISTSYTTNQSLNGFVSATVNVFPYNLPQNGTLNLGLYVNGGLVASSSYSLGQSAAHPAEISQDLVSQPGEALASFTPSLAGYSVSLSLRNPLPSGTVISVVAYASSPIWIQIDSGVHGLSHVEPSASPLPVSLATEQSVAPYTLSIQVQSNAS